MPVAAAHVRARSVRLLGHEFRLFRVPRSRIAGDLVPVWRGTERVLVSSRERTIADCLRNPELCGGVRHLVQIMREYGGSETRDFERLMAAVAEAGSGAAWKRLGYLVEVLWPDEQALMKEAKRRMTTGYARLDPAVRRRGRLVRRWRLWVNIGVEGDGGATSGLFIAGNVKARVPVQNSAASPYFLAGVGFFRVSSTDATVSGPGGSVTVDAGDPESALGVNFGGGLNVAVSPTMGIFGEVTYVLGFTEDESTTALPIKLGLSFRPGSR